MLRLTGVFRTIDPERRGLKAVGALSGLAVLPVYLATLAPTLTWAHHGADGGDLVTAVARGSIPHPPGSPAYLLMGEPFTRLPWGDPAWRLNLMSAVLAAGAVGLTAVAARLLLRSGAGKRGAAAFAICAGLALGLSPLFWSQALIAEVYAPAAFFAALVMVLALRGGPAWALGLAWGVGMGVHPTLLFLAPTVVASVWSSPGKRVQRLCAAGLLALLGWGMLYGPVLLARGSSSPWADVSTPAGWWALVSGQLYRGYLFGLPPADWPQRLLAWAGLLARQFTPLGAALAGQGWALMWQEQRPLAVASALAFGATSLYAIGYDTADSLVYLVPALPLAALWLARGLAWAVDRLGRLLQPGRWLRQTAWAILLLPLLQALLFWQHVDLSGNRTAMVWVEQVLQQAPPEAVLLTDQDKHTFTLWYALDVLGERPDVTVIDQDLWGQEPYRRTVAGALGLEAAGSDPSPEEAAHRAGRPVVRVSDLFIMEDEP